MTNCPIALAATSFALALLVSAPAVAEDPPGDDITIERIASSIQANYDRIQDAQFRLEETIRNPGLSERTEHSVQSRNGVTLTISQEPLVKRIHDVCVRDDSLAPLDLRQAGSRDARDTFVDQLRNSTILEVQTVEDEQNRTFYDVLLKQEKGERSRGLTFRCRFDASRNFLPVHVAYLSPEDEEWMTVDIGYHSVLPQTWFMTHVITTYTRSGEVRQVCEQHVIGDVVVNKGLRDKLFNVEPPPANR